MNGESSEGFKQQMIDQARWKTMKAWTKAMALRLEIMGCFPDGEGFHEGSERSS